MLGHTFLAITVTDLGFWVIISTLYEGLVCAYISERYDLASATIAHGLANLAYQLDLSNRLNK
ncbi:hypothetical protein ACTQ5R_08075 [Ruoffia tabacinasalis]|uniref:hypothetical protein n=1 Tax=Ruoffia tabacinasalis TaxID=87458 RepID=UPI003F974AF8